MKNLNKEEVCNVLFEIHCPLRGVSGLFTQGARDIVLGDEEFYGVGLLLRKMSKELQELESW